LNRSKLKIEEFLPLMLSSAGILGVLPFAIMRFLNDEFVIGVLDSIIVGGLFGLAYYLYRTRKVRLASLCLSLLCVAGMLATVYLNGPAQIFWAYPSMVSVLFLVRRHEAVVITSVAAVALLPALQPTMESVALATAFITIAVTNAFAYAFATVARSQRDSLMQLATKDPLTGVGNRRALAETLETIVASSQRLNEPASLLLIDLDHFKQVNDTHGHAAGDQILISLTEVIKLRIRVSDSLFRIGGEEFVVVVDGQNIDTACQLAEQLRTLVEAGELAATSAVTISIGVAQLQTGEPGDTWLRRADEALYAAKRAGRNLTRLAA
jgi:diguanylate cyclase (GGDEF)-like protein